MFPTLATVPRAALIGTLTIPSDRGPETSALFLHINLSLLTQKRVELNDAIRQPVVICTALLLRTVALHPGTLITLSFDIIALERTGNRINLFRGRLVRRASPARLLTNRVIELNRVDIDIRVTSGNDDKRIANTKTKCPYTSPLYTKELH